MTHSKKNLYDFLSEHVYKNQTYLVSTLIDKGIIRFEEDTDVYEWWVVSSDFADFVKEVGGVVLETDYSTWWGRTTTGQAIVMDDIVHEVYIKMISKP